MKKRYLEVSLFLLLFVIIYQLKLPIIKGRKIFIFSYHFLGLFTL
jgi:hypothetical protein